MRKNFLAKYIWIFLLIGITPWSQLRAVVWAGNVTADVVNDPTGITITADVTIGGPGVGDDHVYVESTAIDMTITPTAASNFTISPLDAAGVCAGNARALHLVATAGRTITVDLSAASLNFRGNNQDFLISFTGAGNLRFLMGDDQEVTFTNVGAASPLAGAFLMVGMDATANTPLAQNVIFSRSSAATNANATVSVEGESMIGFIAPTGDTTGTAIIGFDATNATANTGRLILSIQPNAVLGGVNGGAVAIQGYEVGVADLGTTFSICDIDFTTLAGSRANLQTMFTAGPLLWSGFQLFNANATLPALRRNPWCLDPNPVGIQPGFVLGANGVLVIADETYFDYISATTNVTPTPAIPDEVLERLAVNCINPLVNQVVKDRNPSAFIVDGPGNFCTGMDLAVAPSAWVGRPQIIMNGTSKLYLRSAVACDGLVNDFDPAFPFTVDPTHQFIDRQGNGSVVFDVEGVLDVIAADDLGEGKTINILSLLEADTGGSVLIEDATHTNFKLRLYERDACDRYRQYGKASALINGRMNFFGVVGGSQEFGLQHTDEIHKIYEKNRIAQSEATYIGGETWRLCPTFLNDCPPPISETGERPEIAHYWDTFYIHTSAAFTGLDNIVPSYPSTAANPNASDWAFYHNGFCVDQGTGRSLVLGTDIGALASDLGTIISRDAHDDIYQEFGQAAGSPIIEELLTRPNNVKVTETLPADETLLALQYSTHSFFLGHASNVSIGTPAIPGVVAGLGVNPCDQTTFALNDTPTLSVDGSFIAFETQGGLLNQPDTSVETGQGGIFVDQQGLFSISATQRMSLATMVGVGFNGALSLPSGQMFINNQVGITRSNLDMSDATQRIVVGPTTTISDFTIDWKYTIKDTCPPSATPTYIPYNPIALPAACQQPAVVAANMTNVPTIQGNIDQLLVENSRLGDPATVKFSGVTALGVTTGSKVRELVFSEAGPDSGVAPVGIVITENNAVVGLGTASRNQDSPSAGIVLGINGVILMPNSGSSAVPGTGSGDSTIILNEDVIINNVCPIVTGTNFGVNGIDTLTITSEVPREIRVKSGGALDLSQFDNANKRLRIAGQITLVFEPNSRLIIGTGTAGGELSFVDTASIRLDPLIGQNLPTGTLAASDAYRVKWSGFGTIRLEEDSILDIARGTLLGIESGGLAPQVNCSVLTTLNLVIEDSARVTIGSDADFGGGLQVGNTAAIDGGAVNFNLTINGPDATFEINSQGFFGIGVGIVSKPNGAPNTWSVSPTFNATSFAMTLTQGRFRHNNILSGASENAAVMALGALTAGYTWTMSPVSTSARVLGGGNLVQISGPTAPTVLTTSGVITASLSAGILSSRPTLDDPSKTAPAPGASATTMFNYLKAGSFQSQIVPTAQATQNDQLGQVTIGYVNVTTINRRDVQGVRAADGAYADPTRSLEIGAVGLALSNSGIPTAYIIRP